MHGRVLPLCVQPGWTREGQAQKTKRDTPVRLDGQYYYKILMDDWLNVSYITEFDKKYQKVK